jgi:hypothetical protein
LKLHERNHFGQFIPNRTPILLSFTFMQPLHEEVYRKCSKNSHTAAAVAVVVS